MAKATAEPNAQLFRFLGTLFLIVAILSLAKTVLIPVVLAILFSFLLNPLVRIVQRRGLKRVSAVLVVTVVALIVLGVLTWAILTQVVAFTGELPKFKATIAKKVQTFVSPIQTLTNPVQNGAVAVATIAATPSPSSGHAPITSAVFLRATADNTNIFPKQDPAGAALADVARLDPMTVLGFLARSAQEAVRLIATLGVVIVLVIVMLIFREEMRDRFIRLTGSTRLTVTTRALDEASKRISEYMLRKFIVNAIFGAAVTVLLFLIGVRFSLMWGIMLVLLRFIPGLGVWLSAVPPALVALITYDSWQPVVLVAIVYGFGELLLINVVEPRYVGAQIGLFPVISMVSLTFWTWLWGPIGLLLAIPLTMCLAVLGKYVPQLSFLGILLSDQPAMDTTLRYYQRLLANDQDEAIEIVDEHLEHYELTTVYDELMIPALSCARRDSANGELSKTELDFFYRATREILDDVYTETPTPVLDNAEPTNAAFTMAGCPIGDDGDALALKMTAHQLLKDGRSLEIGASNKLASEIIEWVRSCEPDIVCLAAIGPGQLAQTRFVCKRIRNNFPAIKVVVARLGDIENPSKEREVLNKAGAHYICSTIDDSRRAILQAIKELSYEKTIAGTN